MSFKKKLLISVIPLLLLFINPKTSMAAPMDCPDYGIGVTSSNIASTYVFQSSPTLTFTLTGLQANGNYSIRSFPTSTSGPSGRATSTGELTLSWSNRYLTEPEGGKWLTVFGPGLPGRGCNFAEWDVVVSSPSGGYRCEYLRVSQTRGGQECYAGSGGCIATGTNVSVVTKVTLNGAVYRDGVKFSLNGPGNAGNDKTVNSVNASDEFVTTYSPNSAGSYSVSVRLKASGSPTICSGSFTQELNCGTTCLTAPTSIGIAASSTSSPDPYKICDQIDRNQEHLEEAYNNCIECVGGSETGTEGIWTAIGCIKRDPTEIVQNLMRVGLGMGGGVALLMILAAGFLFSISQGDPKRTGEAKELITAAITGLLFIIFSVVILQFIGYTVLKIPGFGG